MNPNTPEPWQAIERVGDRPIEITDPEANIASVLAAGPCHGRRIEPMSPPAATGDVARDRRGHAAPLEQHRPSLIALEYPDPRTTPRR
jgi:hypothetical protein